MKKACFDLCCGLKGFSQAFENREEWEIITVDLLRKFKPTIIADICHLPLRDGLKPDVLLASPPCQRFSIACPEWPKKGIQKALEMVGACFEAVVSLQPKRWLIENPRGRLRWFIGKGKQMIRYSDYDVDFKTTKVTEFWGNIPFPMVKRQRVIHVGHKEQSWGYVISRDRAKRSRIPKGVSQAVYEGVNLTEKSGV